VAEQNTAAVGVGGVGVALSLAVALGVYVKVPQVSFILKVTPSFKRIPYFDNIICAWERNGKM
jgi:hypothetical protein